MNLQCEWQEQDLGDIQVKERLRVLQVRALLLEREFGRTRSDACSQKIYDNDEGVLMFIVPTDSPDVFLFVCITIL